MTSIYMHHPPIRVPEPDEDQVASLAPTLLRLCDEGNIVARMRCSGGANRANVAHLGDPVVETQAVIQALEALDYFDLAVKEFDRKHLVGRLVERETYRPSLRGFQLAKMLRAKEEE